MNCLQNILAVFRRERIIWAKRPIYFVGSVLIVAFCSVFYLTFLQSGVPTGLPIGVVDNDHSSLSRNFISQLDATPAAEVRIFDTYPEARVEMQRGRITSICVIPEGMYRDVSAQKQPEMTFYINGLYFMGGSLAYSDLLTMINLTSGAVQRQVLRMKGMNDAQIMGMIKPVELDTHMIGNSTMNYGAYLGSMMIPGVLEMVMVVLIVYSLGTELKYGGSRRLMELSGGSIGVALLGKLILYTIFFFLLGVTIEMLLYSWCHYPFAGSVWYMFLDVFLLVLASEAMGITIISFCPVLRFALSVSSLYTVLAFSLTGFTLPLEAMPEAFQYVSAIFPLKHYYQFFVQEGIFGTGFTGWWQEVCHFLIFLIFPMLGIHRLKHAYIYQDYEQI